MHNRANIIGWLAILFNAGAQLVLAPVIKSRMGAPGLGLWHLVFQTFVYLQLIDFGCSGGIVREIASSRWDAAGPSHNRLVKTIQGLLSATGVIFAVAGIGAACLVPRLVEIPEFFQWDFVLAVLLLAGWGMPRYHYGLPLLALRGRNRIVAYNCLELIQGAGRPLLGVLMALAHMGLVGIAAGYALAEAATRWIAGRLCPLSTVQGYFDRGTFYRILKFGGAAGAVSLSTMITFYSSSFIVGWKMGVMQVAVYQSTIALPLLLMRLAIIPFTNLLPSLISGFQRKNDAGLMAAALRLHLFVLLASGFFLLAICFINELFVALWVGSELFAGIHFNLVYSIFLFVSIARHNGYMLWQARGRLKAMTVAHLIEVPLNIGLSVIFINAIGLKGIAWAFIVAASPAAFISQLSFFLKK